MFIITFLSILVLSFATAGFHAFRVAWTNPVENLRYEKQRNIQLPGNQFLIMGNINSIIKIVQITF